MEESDRRAMCDRLRNLQRHRAVILKSRIMQENRLTAVVAGSIGYSANMEEVDRKKAFVEAAGIIHRIDKGEMVDTPMLDVIKTTLIGIRAFDDAKCNLEKQMKGVAGELPVAKWVSRPEQRGFGILFLAIVIGETGDLANYMNNDVKVYGDGERGGVARRGGVYKLYRRLGCAPWTYPRLPDGKPDIDNGAKTLMGNTWRSGREGSLPAEEWALFGYSPRRRSIAYLIGESMVKLNGATEGRERGPYRKRYDEVKMMTILERPDWTRCAPCDGSGKAKRKKGDGEKACESCAGKGKVYKRVHLHAMLLATKLLLKNLWIEWNYGI